jgi:hypothetical protein
MKKFMKIGALSLALIASLVLLSNSTNAQVPQTGDVSLEITTTSGTCVYGTSLYIGSHAAQYATYNMTGTEFPELFSCTDTEGLATFSMTMQATSTLSDGVIAHDIPAVNVSMIVNPQRLAAGACDYLGTTQVAWAEIGTNPGTILNKSGVEGDICTLSATGVNLAVVIPASQAVGIYTGELSLDMPF